MGSEAVALFKLSHWHLYSESPGEVVSARYLFKDIKFKLHGKIHNTRDTLKEAKSHDEVKSEERFLRYERNFVPMP